MKTAPQPTRPEPDLGNIPKADPGEMTDDGKSMDEAVSQNPVLFRTTPSSQREKTLKAKTHKQNKQYHGDRFMTNQVEMSQSVI